MSDAPTTTSRPKLRWYQFSLRGLMIFVLLASVVLSYAAAKFRQARNQEEAILAMEANVTFDFEDEYDSDGCLLKHHARDSKTPLLLHCLRGSVTEVLAPDMDDTAMEHLERLPRVRHLDIWGSRVTDVGFAHVAKLPDLQVVILQKTEVGDNGWLILRGGRRSSL